MRPHSRPGCDEIDTGRAPEKPAWELPEDARELPCGEVTDDCLGADGRQQDPRRGFRAAVGETRRCERPDRDRTHGDEARIAFGAAEGFAPHRPRVVLEVARGPAAVGRADAAVV